MGLGDWQRARNKKLIICSLSESWTAFEELGRKKIQGRGCIQICRTVGLFAGVIGRSKKFLGLICFKKIQEEVKLRMENTTNV
jgi:hypothetical protein